MTKKVPFKVIELELKSYHFIVEGKINDEAVLLIIDTGASRTIIDSNYSHLLEKICLTNETPIATGLMAEQIPVELFSVQSFSLGKRIFKDVHALAADLTAINEVYLKLTGKKIAGLIGSDFILEHIKSIDLTKKCLILHDDSIPA